jgi:CotS family spore coat protein
MIQKRVYRVTASDGASYCLKQMAYPPAQLRWIDQVLQRLRANGFSRIGWRNPNHRAGKRLYVRLTPEGAPFVLVPWLQGSWPSPRSGKQMRACGNLLARFHQAGSRIAIPRAGSPNKLGSWPANLRSERNKLLRMIRKAERSGFGRPLDSLLRTHGQEMLRMADASLRALSKGGYSSACRSAKPTLCHGDGGPTNIIHTRRGLHLIDFETLRLDLPAYDLYRIIYNSSQDHRWRFGIAASILGGYRQVRSLGPADYRMLKALLRFPRGMCKLVGGYESQSLKGKRQIERRFPVILADERRRGSFLQQLDRYASQKAL